MLIFLSDLTFYSLDYKGVLFIYLFFLPFSFIHSVLIYIALQLSPTMMLPLPCLTKRII